MFDVPSSFIVLSAVVTLLWLKYIVPIGIVGGIAWKFLEGIVYLIRRPAEAQVNELSLQVADKNGAIKDLSQQLVASNRLVNELSSQREQMQSVHEQELLRAKHNGSNTGMFSGYIDMTVPPSDASSIQEVSALSVSEPRAPVVPQRPPVPTRKPAPPALPTSPPLLNGTPSSGHRPPPPKRAPVAPTSSKSPALQRKGVVVGAPPVTAKAQSPHPVIPPPKFGVSSAKPASPPIIRSQRVASSVAR